MKTIYTVKLTDFLPDSIVNDPSISAAAEAFDVEIQKALLQKDNVLIWAHLDSLSGRILDFLAEWLSVDAWDPTLSDEVKRKTIKASLPIHKIRGTKKSLEDAIKTINLGASISEWYEYGGTPYRFKLSIELLEDEPFEWAAFGVLNDIINQNKNERSHLEGTIVLIAQSIFPMRIGIGNQSGLNPIILPWSPDKITADPAIKAKLTVLLSNSTVTIQPVSPPPDVESSALRLSAGAVQATMFFSVP